MTVEPKWISLETAIFIHDSQIKEHGGSSGLRDENLLSSAINQPKFSYQYGKISIPELAADYAYHLCKNNPFIDGNKRTAYVVSRLFLKRNKYEFKASISNRLIIFINLADNKIEKENLAQWFDENTEIIF